MRAIVFTGPGRFELADVPDPKPGPREVVVRVVAVGICGTDVHVLDGEFEPTVFPITPGHETSGIVEAVGAEVSEFTPGDRVSVDPTLTCGECTFCRAGRPNLCERWDGSGVARTNGSAAELMLAPVRNVYRLPDGVDLELAALIEPLSCAIHGYDLLPRRLGEHYLIYGAGTMGLMMAQLAPRAGAASVTVVDRNPDRLRAAREVGIDLVAESADDHNRPGGWDVVIDCTGAVGAIEDGLGRVRRGGTFQQFGVAPTDARAAFSPFRIYNDEVTVVGSMAVLNSYERAVELFAAGVLNAAPMVSHAFPLTDYGRAIEQFRAGTGRKLQLRPGLDRSTALL
ncbi:zinc-dependent alcohol dehydrogenase family protein [Microlunatus speluncae]|uniref:zinc-dependent alcohol dehydrogenase family protein n=1 Tax=Microlunatus speluncae TaxID=2594267 RepID=UPI001266606A|nr:zinc-dependent alcohol dehydrogenase family protein [Microlunatus speluncae]